MQGVGCDCALTQVQQQQGQLVLGGENALVVWACERASEPTNQEHRQSGPSSAPACWRSEGGCVQRGAVRAPYTNVTVDTHVHVACTGVWLSVWSVSYSIFWATRICVEVALGLMATPPLAAAFLSQERNG